MIESFMRTAIKGPDGGSRAKLMAAAAEMCLIPVRRKKRRRLIPSGNINKDDSSTGIKWQRSIVSKSMVEKLILTF